jgi:hypothetical protein
MAILKNKEELLHSILGNYEKLKTELAGIPSELAGIRALEGHSKNTVMSVNNLLAYLVGWGQLLLKWSDRKDKGLEVDFPETGFKWNELGRLAQKFYQDYEQDDEHNLNTQLYLRTKLLLAKLVH